MRDRLNNIFCNKKLLAFCGLCIIAVCVTIFFALSNQNKKELSSVADEDSVGGVNLEEFSEDQTILDSMSVENIAEEILPEDRGLYYSVYKVKKGDTVSEIAFNHDITTDSIFSVNGITSARTLQIGRYLKIPSQNGIMYEIKKDDTVDSIASAYSISPERIIEANGLKDVELPIGKNIFLPDAKLSLWTLREISGDLFRWPIHGRLTSWYGWRRDPFTGARSFHNGIDIATSRGTPIKPAMEGTVVATGFSSGYGNYVIISHHSGYRTLYGHMDKILVRNGAYVITSTTIGLVGSTGYSTGPHVHFTVYKNGRMLNPMTILP